MSCRHGKKDGDRVLCSLKPRGSMAERIRIQQLEPKPTLHPMECSWARLDDQAFCPCYAALGAAASARR